eukprot:CAMPEP_0168163384 /NCGR_PEP_ID=MMETSP0139_2-20121125/348_1 /TAXON_ID=44445 /ORGANISM="Pseudo-nitzschia australis, Strain 10249 10 AB" /LENGTH=344 /DNA_ID=CAMNT_0008080277 /DNA_START=281 /DNA_END=1315 /DNA_ORIENTATION=+
MAYNLRLQSQKNTRNWMKINTLHAAGVNTNDEEVAVTSSAAADGLYKKFADHAAEQLLETGWLKNDDTVPLDLSEKQAPARGSKTESIVRITTQALIPKTKASNSDDNDDENKQLVRYARITLLETVPVSSEGDGVVSPNGIQVLNFVVLPNADTTLPVLGIDLVSLPGSRHLLLLDAQPMAVPNPHESHWEEWYNKHVRGSVDHPEKISDESLKYAWGGDFPETVKKYVSKYALWTRLQNISEDTSTEQKPSDDKTMSNDTSTTPAVKAIQEDIFVAFQAHLDAYLELLGRYASDIAAVEGDNHQSSYLDYRRNNDPAKPMLNSLFGPEWTQTLLDKVLFPQD